ncbi:uncharacterized protein [Amphiura filiformis]|uniref:uncharacterized protein n=1 Tax=Amphiura filiformis TaxID=82378 RepID=UPI003B214155
MATFLSEKGIFSLVFMILFVKWSLLQLSRAQGNQVIEGRSSSDEPDGIVPISFGLIVGAAIAGSLVLIMLILVLIALVVCIRSGTPPKSRRRPPQHHHQAHANYYTNYDTHNHHDHHDHHVKENNYQNGGVYVNKAYVYEGQLKSTDRSRENNINNTDIESSENRTRQEASEQVSSTYRHQEQESQPAPVQKHHSPARDNHHDHDNPQHEERTQIVHNERAIDVSTPTPQPMYESLDDVKNRQNEYGELPLPDTVDPDGSYHSEWPPRPELTKTRHNLVEIPSDSGSSSSSSPSPPSVIEMVIHHGHDETDAEVESYPPPPANFM